MMPFTPCLLFTITVHGKLLKFYLLYRFCRFEGKFLDIVHQDSGNIIAFYSHVLKADMLNVPKTEIVSKLSKKNLSSHPNSALIFFVELQHIIFLIQPGRMESQSENRSLLRIMELAMLLFRPTPCKQFLLGNSTTAKMSCPWARIHLYYVFST